MDTLDRFNEAVVKAAISWRNIFAFVASVFLLGTLLEIAESSPGAWLIISWALIAVLAFLIFFTRKRHEKTAA
jgi:hypothetical protein